MARKAGIEDYLRMMLGPQPKQHIAKTAADMLFGGVAQAPPPNASLADQAMHALAQPGVMPIGMTAWHGTPHKFAPTPKNPYGEFDLSKIGTGEGAQAYGHGIYLSEGPAVANTYRNKVAAMHGSGEVKVGGRKINWDDPRETAAFELARHGGDRKAAADFYERTFRKPEVPALLRSGAPLPEVEMAGRTYKVDLPDEAVGRMLDWDAPFSQQPQAVKDAIGRELLSRDYFRQKFTQFPKSDPPGGAILDMVRDFRSGDPKRAASVFRSMGIPGIQYLDQGSRVAGKGTRNFVVFEPDILKIQGVE